MPTGSQDKLAHCRGIRRMHLNSNMSACEQAPVSQFGSSAHGSLLRAKFQFVKRECFVANRIKVVLNMFTAGC